MARQLAVAAFAMLGILITISAPSMNSASAHDPHPGLEFSIGVRGVPGCNTRASDVTCTLPSGQPFVLEFYLDQLPDDIPNYGGYDLYARFAGVTPTGEGSTDVWPDCAFPASFAGDGFIAMACAVGVPPAGPSSWVGPIGEQTFTCTQSGSITMAHGGEEGETNLVEFESLAKHSDEGSDAEETINITCGSLPQNTPGVVTGGTPGPEGPTPGQVRTPTSGQTTPGQGQPTLEPTAAAMATQTALARGTDTPGVAGTPTAEPGDGSNDGDSNTWVWVVIIVAAVAAIGIAGFGYWYYRRRIAGPSSSGGAPPAGGSTT
jgi:hypothetical protein